MAPLAVRFGPDFAQFCCGTAHGFHTFNLAPVRQVQHVFLGGGVRLAAPVFRSGLVVLVAGGPKPAFPVNKVVVYDLTLDKSVIELAFDSPVLGACVSRTRIVVVLQSRVHVYSLSDIPEQILYFDTASNPHAACALSSADRADVLAFPSVAVGCVGVAEFVDGPLRTRAFQAHKHPIQIMALNRNGSLLATASTLGTIIRVFDTQTGQRVHEFRRGSQNATITWFLRRVIGWKGSRSQAKLLLSHSKQSTRRWACFCDSDIVVVDSNGILRMFSRNERNEFECKMQRQLVELE